MVGASIVDGSDAIGCCAASVVGWRLAASKVGDRFGGVGRVSQKRDHRYRGVVNRWAQAGTVLISAVVVGVVAYLAAVASGATHTICSASTGASYCDTHASASAVIALVAGAFGGGAVALAALTLLSRRSTATK
jgi:hypothetical protein